MVLRNRKNSPSWEYSGRSQINRHLLDSVILRLRFSESCLAGRAGDISWLWMGQWQVWEEGCFSVQSQNLILSRTELKTRLLRLCLQSLCLNTPTPNTYPSHLFWGALVLYKPLLLMPTPPLLRVFMFYLFLHSCFWLGFLKLVCVLCLLFSVLMSWEHCCILFLSASFLRPCILFGICWVIFYEKILRFYISVLIRF